VQVAQLMPEKIKAENELDRSLIVFKNTIGFPADEEIVPQGELECKSVQLSTAQAFQAAVQNRHEVAAAQFRVQGMNAALDVARADRYPSLSLAGSAQMETDEPTFDSAQWRTKIWAVSLGLSIPVFDGLRTKGKISQTRAELEQARLYSEQILDGIRLEVEQAVSRLNEARQLVESQVAAVEQAQKGFDIANIRYENGVGTQLEVLDAQVALSRARTNYFMSVYQHFMAMAELERAVGTTPR
jgi:outer membrane protein